MKYLTLFFIILSITSCANVEQIDRDRLSSKVMRFDAHPEESVFLEEINSYREGAVGGSKSVGGGCGCN